MVDLIIKNVRIYQPESSWHGKNCDLLIRDGCLEKIESHGGSSVVNQSFDQMDASGLTLAPSFVDTSFWLGEPGFERLEDFNSASNLAYGSGYGHLFVMPDLNPPVDHSSLVRFIAEKSELTGTDFHSVGRLTRKVAETEYLTEMMDMSRAGAVAFSNGRRGLYDLGALERSMRYTVMCDRMLMQYPLEPSLSKNGVVHACAATEQMGLPGIFGLAESMGVSNQLKLAEFAGAPCFLMTITSEDTVDLLKQAKSKGREVYSSVSVMNIAENYSAQETYDPMYKLWPVLRSESDRKALVEALKSGDIDLVTANHQPVAIEDKKKEFGFASFGAIGLQYAFPLLLESLGGSVALDLALEILSLRPRRIFPLEEVQFIPGEKADYVLIDPNREWQFSKTSNLSKSVNSPYFNRTFKGMSRALIRSTKFFDYGIGVEK
ncbi:MAG TPA: dihydroorotase [Saprospiraceae bacterium]|nr:dihydroorotase [Saprospiraceae bacterium]